MGYYEQRGYYSSISHSKTQPFKASEILSGGEVRIIQQLIINYLKRRIMEIIGRITDNARISKLKDGREVVNFCVAINERYKNKEGKTIKTTAFINCSYWIGSTVAEYLHKGMIVSLYGNLSSKAYIDNNGEAQPVLYFHTNNIKLISKANKTA